MTIVRSQYFGAVFSDLGAVGARPDAMYLGAGTPKRKIFFEVSATLQHRTRNDPMNVHGTPVYIGQNALTGCRFATHVVMFGGDRRRKRPRENAGCPSIPCEFE